MRRTALVVSLLGAVIALLVAGAPAGATGLDQTCELTATRFDPDTLNVLFPDQSAQYWSTHYTAIPGTRLRIEGVFPYARYTSWNAYDLLLRPFAHLADLQLQPDPGSSNPFLPGARRGAPVSARHYTLFVTFSPSDHPGPNTIFIDPTKDQIGLLTLRVYVPDAGRDVAGGVGLPQVTWEPAAGGGPPAAMSPCTTVEKPTVSTLSNAYAALNGPDAGPPLPGRNPPVWHKFVNLCQSGADLLLDNPLGDLLPKPSSNPCASFGSGGFLSNLDNAYVYSFVSRGFGPLVVFHGRAPTFAATYPHAAVMPGGDQVRYWSFCQNDPVDQRYIACRRDDQIAVDRSGNYTIVVSQPGTWPAAAAQRCRRTATWLPWGPQTDGVLIYRQMLPASTFTQAIQRVAYGSEQRQMGPYYPLARYFAGWQAVAQAYCARG